MSLLLKNGRIITESGVLSGGYLLIEGENIVKIGCSDRLPQAGEVIDLGAKFVAPGFVDIHTHGIADSDFMAHDPDLLHRGIESYLRFGVTGILPSTVSITFDTIIEQIKLIRRVRDENTHGDIVLGVHVEGPWLSWRCRGGHPEEFLLVPEKEHVNRLIGEVGDIVKTVTFAPELDNAVWLCETLSLHGIIPVIGHTAATYDQTMDVIRAGARHVTHLFDADLGIHESETEALTFEPGMETAALIDDGVSVELIGCPIHVPKPLFKLVDKIKPRDKKILVSDSLIGAGMPDGSVISFRDGRQAEVSDGVLRMIYRDNPELHGNLTGSAITMNMAVKRLSEYIDAPLEEASRWATINPATLLGREQERGSLRVGKRADVVVFDDNVDVTMTILGGKPVYKASF
jgi:N-acetylglucosamine-6-phosphate deacetylase